MTQPDMFQTAAAEPVKARKPRKPRKNSRHGWTIEPHVCRACLGRVLSRIHGETKELICSNCGVVGAGPVTSICTCGAKFNTGRDIGIRCMPNPAITPASPSQIVSGEPR